MDPTLTQVIAWIAGTATFLILMASLVGKVASPFSKFAKKQITRELDEKLDEVLEAVNELSQDVATVRAHIVNGSATPLHERVTALEHETSRLSAFH